MFCSGPVALGLEGRLLDRTSLPVLSRARTRTSKVGENESPVFGRPVKPSPSVS